MEAFNRIMLRFIPLTILVGVQPSCFMALLCPGFIPLTILVGVQLTCVSCCNAIQFYTPNNFSRCTTHERSGIHLQCFIPLTILVGVQP